MNMRINIGSLQRKRGRFYYVARKGKSQVSVSLKTGGLRTAQKRVRLLLHAGDGEEEWLLHLAALGRRAEKKLAELRAGVALGWDGLAEAFFAKNPVGVSSASRASYSRWLSILSAAGRASAPSPAEFSAADARKTAESLAKRYLSCRRMLDFYRRCWTTIGLDPAIWDLGGRLRKAISESGRDGEYYRRLSFAEIAKLHAYLQKRNRSLADMVEIGYMTGLRLSDVALLDAGEVADGGERLCIVPGKTSRRKKRPLSIPLIYGARAAMKRLLAESSRNGANPANGRAYLFDAAARRRPSKRLTAAFWACGIEKRGRARASFHSLRATFISLMDEAGVPPHITDSVTGHGGGGMHARYTQPSHAAVRAAMERAITPLRRQTVSDIVSGPR